MDSGGLIGPRSADPVTMSMTMMAQGLLLICLCVGAAAADVGRLPGMVRVIPVGLALALIATAVPGLRRCNTATGWIEIFAAAGAGVALGSRGLVALGVVAAIPLAWMGGAADRGAQRVAAVGSALAGGLAAAALVGRLSVAEAATGAVAVAVGWGAIWMARSTADDIGGAELERTELRRIRTEMVTTVSHELRTPLTVIQGVTSTLSRRWDLLSEAERMDLIDVLGDNVASLDASIQHFADAARLQRGSMVIAPGWVEVVDAVAAACTRRAGPLAGHEVCTDIGVAKVWADRTAIERILEHLLLNAARFSPLGQPITVRTARKGSQAAISVADRGQGIAPRLMATVWEPLQRGDVSDTGVSRGAGLGLPIVKELARLHGGDASLTSARGRGTTVTVTLPQPDNPDPLAQSVGASGPVALRP